MPSAIINVPTGVEDFSLEQAFFLLGDLYGKLDAHAEVIAQPLELLCKPGCSACCRQCVFVTPLEALYLMHHMQQHFTALQMACVVTAALKTVELNKERILGFGHVECPGAPPLSPEERAPRPRPLDRVLSAKTLIFDCPLLDDGGLCTAYPARELRARLFAVSRLKSRDEYYACDLLGKHLDGKTVKLIDAEGVQEIMHRYPLTEGEQVIPYFLWRYSALLV